MKTYGETKFEDRVLVLSDMTSMVKCVEKLPDLTEDSEGWVCQLIGTQPGYVATHIYKCVKTDDEELIWVDITSSTEVSEATGLSEPKFKKVKYTDGRLRIIVIWQQPEPISGTEVWERDVLVRKLDNVPTSPIDGEVLTNDIDINEDQHCIYESNFLNNPDGNYMYRIFHLYQSGKVTYTEVPDASDPTKSELNWEDIKYLTSCGVASKIFSVGDTFTVTGTHATYGTATWNLKISTITDPYLEGEEVHSGEMKLVTASSSIPSGYMSLTAAQIKATIQSDFRAIFSKDSDLVVTAPPATPVITATITGD